MLLDLSVATLGAPQTAIDIDVAELLVACTVLVGPERALRAACAGPGDQAVAGALPYMERAALTPHLRDLAHDHDVALKKLREAAAEQTGRSCRSSSRSAGSGRATSCSRRSSPLAAYLLITKLAKIGFGTIASELAPLRARVGRGGADPRPAHLRPAGDRPSGGRGDAAAAPSVRPARDGRQVPEPDRPGLGRKHRAHDPLPAAAGRADRRGRRRRVRSTGSPRRSCRSRSC